MDWRGVAVAGVVLIAGCNGIAFGERAPSPTETVTPVPVDVAEGTRATAAANAPPGVSMDGTIDLSALLSAHRAHVDGRIDSYTWVARAERTVDNRTVPERTYTRRVRKEGDVFLVEHVDGPSRNLTLYVPASTGTGYLRTVTPGRRNLETVEGARPHTQYVFAGDMIRQFLRSGGVSVRTIERNGGVLYRLHANRPGSQLGGNSLRETISNYTATAYVTETGFVRTMVVDYDRRVDGTVRHTYLRYDYSAVDGTSVARPAWVDRVPTRTATSTATPAPNATTTTGPPPSATTPTPNASSIPTDA